MSHKTFSIPFPVVLASASPRRKELLSQLIEGFEIVTADVEEIVPAKGDPRPVAEGLARQKALAVAARRPEALVIAGDTVVALPGEKGPSWLLLSKPEDTADAGRMLALLSGKTHTVVTAVCLNWPKGERLFSVSSDVTFRELSASEIESYIATGETLDKAGAYAVQGGAKNLIARIEGSTSNVIGLPLEALEAALTTLFPVPSGQST